MVSAMDVVTARPTELDRYAALARTTGIIGITFVVLLFGLVLLGVSARSEDAADLSGAGEWILLAGVVVVAAAGAFAAAAGPDWVVAVVVIAAGAAVAAGAFLKPVRWLVLPA